MLDKRLQMIYDLVTPDIVPGGKICDIGTDHAKVPIALLEDQKIDFAYLTDLNEGPLNAARENVEKHGLSHLVEFVQSNGFNQLSLTALLLSDCFIISGMGGGLIMSILKARYTDRFLVLQPMTDIPELVMFLQKNNYKIFKRVFCKDGDKIYTAMLVKHKYPIDDPSVFKDFTPSYGPFQLNPFMATEKNEVYYEYLRREKVRINKVIEALKIAKDYPLRERRLKTHAIDLQIIDKMLEGEGKTDESI